MAGRDYPHDGAVDRDAGPGRAGRAARHHPDLVRQALVYYLCLSQGLSSSSRKPVCRARCWPVPCDEGPLVGGKQHFWDVEKIAGDIVYTMPPYVIEPLFNRCGDLEFKEEVLSEDMPAEVLHKMSQIPYCIQSSDPNGMETDQFNVPPGHRRYRGDVLQGVLGAGGIRRSADGRSKRRTRRPAGRPLTP